MTGHIAGLIWAPLDTGRTRTTENPFRFTGGHRDPTGQYKIGLRTTLPNWAVGLKPILSAAASTPEPSEASPYIYAGSNPINCTDPSGAYGWKDFAGTIGAFAEAGAGIGSVIDTKRGGRPVWARCLMLRGLDFPDSKPARAHIREIACDVRDSVGRLLRNIRRKQRRWCSRSRFRQVTKTGHP